MLSMRSATPDDITPVTRMILARCAWMEERDLPSWRDSAEMLAAQASDNASGMWILEDAALGIIGCTTLQTQTPPWGWTPVELGEPAYYLYTTVTDPAYREMRAGSLIAMWAVDRAAREGKDWVRRGCLSPSLVRYYKTQGFSLRYQVPRAHNTVYLMARRAEIISDLDQRVRTVSPVALRVAPFAGPRSHPEYDH